jgi:hypothetical protein
MSEYHKHSEELDHRALWPKRARILGPNSIEIIKNLDFFRSLQCQLNIHRITGEEQSGWEEMYWRIVRPGSSDIGYYHADKWFWDFGHGESPDEFKRVKIWIAIDTVPGLSGLRVILGSHLRDDWDYSGEADHTGITKPKFNEDIEQFDIHNVSTQPGQFIIFNDSLIHSGMPNLSNTTRVSLEATFLISTV